MARSQPTTLLAGAIISTALLGALPVSTVQADDDDDNNRKRSFRVRLSPFQEVPSLSTPASGQFRLRISRDETTMSYELSYADLTTPVTQAHIHFGQKGVAAGISVWLCGTAALPGPTGTPVCPNSATNSGTVSRTVGPADVVGPAGQGIGPGEFAELLKAIRAGVTYANVHSQMFVPGELRGQIK